VLSEERMLRRSGVLEAAGSLSLKCRDTSNKPKAYDLLIAVRVRAKTAKKPMNPPRVLRGPPARRDIQEP